MEPWVFFILGATFLRGISSFTTKVVSTKDLNYDYVIFLLAVFGFISSSLFFGFINFSWSMLIFGILLSILNLTLIKLSFAALENISSSIFFISFRTVSTIILIFVGMLMFDEYLTAYQYLGIIFGFVTFFLLFDEKDVPNKSANFSLGIVFLVIYTLVITITNTFNKYISLNFIIVDYIFHFFSAFVVLSFLSFLLFNHKKKNFGIDVKDSRYYGYAFILGTIFYFAWRGILMAYSMQSLAIVYKILSFEIVIPIILSLIVYKERLTKRKTVAFFLTVCSILLLT